MKKKNDWLLRKVRVKHKPDGPIGTVVMATQTFRWWLIEWPDGKRSQWPERLLEIVTDAPA